MSDYKPDPNDSKKQVPGPKTDQHYDRWSQLPVCSGSHKQPTYVIVSSTTALGLGFYFGRESQFSASSAIEHNAGLTGDNKDAASLSGSEHYLLLGDPVTAGTYNINPIAVSGSAADVAKVRFVYKGGLDGLGRP